SSGQAVGKQGFVNITMSSGKVQLGSASPGSSSNAQLVGSVASQPYNLSVLQISSPIIPNGIENSNAPSNSPTPPPSKAPSPSRGKAPSPRSKSSSTANTPTPSSRPSPAAHGPVSAANSPGGNDAADKDKDDKKNSAIGIRAFGIWITILMLVACWESVVLEVEGFSIHM
ncbi:hypothetical protein Ancab_012644, partial [Ancistrocladus abbreviatus]